MINTSSGSQSNGNHPLLVSPRNKQHQGGLIINGNNSSNNNCGYPFNQQQYLGGPVNQQQYSGGSQHYAGGGFQQELNRPQPITGKNKSLLGGNPTSLLKQFNTPLQQG